jgi:hypothetical protein
MKNLATLAYSKDKCQAPVQSFCLSPFALCGLIRLFCFLFCSTEQKEALLELLKHQTHHLISAEVRRELVNAKCRDVEMDEPMDEPAM